jgi:4-amino-4-deoxy-L-arabinose transferase-like glycosyltransferase
LIYSELSRHWLATGSYSLAGSGLLNRLPRSFYDHPVFHHPPGFPMLLAPFVLTKSDQLAVTLSWLGHALSFAAVALVGYELLLHKKPPDFRNRCVFLLPLVAAAADPLMNFIARKIWMDNLLAGTTSLALCAAWLGGRKERWQSWLGAAGALAAVASSMKVTAAIVLPFAAWFAIPEDRRQPIARLLTVLLPATLVLGAWFLYFHERTGVWLPYWTRPDADFLKANPILSGNRRRRLLAGYYLLVPRYDEILSPVDLLLLIFAGKT